MPEKKSAIADVLAKASKKYDLAAGPVSQVAMDAQFITTGNLAIDYIMGGGVPMGRSVELAGPPSSGKSTTALQLAARIQKVIREGGDPSRGIGPDDYLLYMDYEHTIDPKYAKALGLDTDDPQFLLAQPETLEQGANFARDLLHSGDLRLMIWDSVASMIPSKKAEEEVGKSLPAVQAKLMSDFSQLLNPELVKYNCTNIWINHLKELVQMQSYGRPSGPRMGTPGGTSMKFYASVRVEYKQLEKIKATRIDKLTNMAHEEVVAQKVVVKVTKNKVAPPFREALVRVEFGKGFDNFWSALQVLVSYKEIMVSAGWHKFHKVEAAGLAPDWMPHMATGTKPPAIRGEAAVVEAADAHPEWKAAIIAHAEAVLARSEEERDAMAAREDEESEEEQVADAPVDASELEELLS